MKKCYNEKRMAELEEKEIRGNNEGGEMEMVDWVASHPNHVVVVTAGVPEKVVAAGVPEKGYQCRYCTVSSAKECITCWKGKEG